MRLHDGVMTRIDDAFAAVPRACFLPPDQRPFAQEDRPLPIGYDATNSQPWTVRYMLEHLDVCSGHRVLDVGSGSGWTTALLAYLVGETGQVVGVEIVPELVQMGRANLRQVTWARIEQASPGRLGWPEEAPYDRILVSADGGRVPQELTEQLAPDGRMVLPVSGAMVVCRHVDGRISQRATGGSFRFVPLQP